MAICPAELRLILLSQALRVGSVRDAKDIVHQVVLVFILHDGIPCRSERHLLQALTLLVVCVAAFRAVAELGVNGMSVFVINHFRYNNALPTMFITPQLGPFLYTDRISLMELLLNSYYRRNLV